MGVETEPYNFSACANEYAQKLAQLKIYPGDEITVDMNLPSEFLSVFIIGGRILLPRYLIPTRGVDLQECHGVKGGVSAHFNIFNSKWLKVEHAVGCVESILERDYRNSWDTFYFANIDDLNKCGVCAYWTPIDGRPLHVRLVHEETIKRNIIPRDYQVSAALESFTKVIASH